MPPSTVDALLQTNRGFVIAAAGCGKTEAIATAVSKGNPGRQLILTHTHAGVKALRDRLLRLGVAEQRFRVDTIAGWCLRYGASFPLRSGLTEHAPTSADWGMVYPAASNILDVDAVQHVIRSSYVGLFVDEYQDCTRAQHAVIMKLASLLPCRILGDPLQGIFDFTADPMVDWDVDVRPSFEELPTLETPHRWKLNQQLGNKLLEVRHALLEGGTVDLQAAPFKWHPLPDNADAQIAAQIVACEDLYNANGSVVAIRQWARECYVVAGRLRGRYTCMEEMDCKDLLASATAIESTSGVGRCEAVFAFVDKCMTGVATPLSSIRKTIKGGELPTPHRLRFHSEVAQSVIDVATESTLRPVAAMLKEIGAVPGRRIFAANFGASFSVLCTCTLAVGAPRCVMRPGIYDIASGDKVAQLRSARSREHF